jgi:hypothetical protein
MVPCPLLQDRDVDYYRGRAVLINNSSWSILPLILSVVVCTCVLHCMLFRFLIPKRISSYLNGVITLCIDSNTHLLYIYIYQFRQTQLKIKDMVYSYMFRLIKSSTGWVKNQGIFTEWLRTFGIPDGLQCCLKLSTCNLD